MTREACAPVEIIDDHRATRRCVIDETESDEETLLRAFELIDRGREMLAQIERQMEWRLEARRCAYSIDEVK